MTIEWRASGLCLTVCLHWFQFVWLRSSMFDNTEIIFLFCDLILVRLETIWRLIERYMSVMDSLRHYIMIVWLVQGQIGRIQKVPQKSLFVNNQILSWHDFLEIVSFWNNFLFIYRSAKYFKNIKKKHFTLSNIKASFDFNKNLLFFLLYAFYYSLMLTVKYWLSWQFELDYIEFNLFYVVQSFFDWYFPFVFIVIQSIVTFDKKVKERERERVSKTMWSLFNPNSLM